MQHFSKRWIQREVPPADLFIDDRTDFPIPGVFQVEPPMKTDFGGQADSHWPVPALRHADSWADMVPDPFPSPARLDAAKNVKTRLKPFGEPVRDLESFVKCMVARQHSIHDRLLPIHSVVAVQLDHR